MTIVKLWVLTMVFSGGYNAATPVPNHIPPYHPTEEACKSQGRTFYNLGEKAYNERGRQSMAYSCDEREVIIFEKSK